MVKKLFFSVVSFLLVISFFSSEVKAENYGAGNYGSGNYGEGSSETSITSSVLGAINSAFSCTDSTPGSKAPLLYGALVKSPTQIELVFTDAQDPYDYYYVEYGLSSGKYLFGANKIATKGQRTAQIKLLMPGITYYFRIRAGNGCATGPWSNEISGKTTPLFSGGLEFVSSNLTTAKPEETNLDNSCQTHTVETGDTLYSIALEELDSGAKSKEIVELNKSTYPSLESSNNLKIDWKLKIKCEQPEIKEESEGYNLKVRVLDTNQKAIKGAKVTVYSTPKEAIADEEGYVSFEGLEKGPHKVVIAYDNYQGEQMINLEGDNEEFELAVQVKPISSFKDKTVLSVIGGLVFIIVLLMVIVMRIQYLKRKSAQVH